MRAALWMLGTVASFFVSALAIRLFSAELGLQIIEILAIRNVVGLGVLLALLAAMPRLRKEIRLDWVKLHAKRNSLHFVAQYLWAYSLTRFSFAIVFALEFTSIAWTTLLSRIMLSEKLNDGRIAVVILGTMGVVCVVIPSRAVEAFELASLVLIAVGAMYGLRNVTTKQLTKFETSFAVVFWMQVMHAGISLAGISLEETAFGIVPFASLSQSSLDGQRVLLYLACGVAGVGVAGLTAHYCMTKALELSDASFATPIDFLRVPLIALMGWYLYNETLDWWFWIGTVLIFVGVVWNLRAQGRNPSGIIILKEQGESRQAVGTRAQCPLA